MCLESTKYDMKLCEYVVKLERMTVMADSHAMLPPYEVR